MINSGTKQVTIIYLTNLFKINDSCKNNATVFAWRTVTNHFSVALFRNVCFAFSFAGKLELH